MPPLASRHGFTLMHNASEKPILKQINPINSTKSTLAKRIREPTHSQKGLAGHAADLEYLIARPGLIQLALGMFYCTYGNCYEDPGPCNSGIIGIYKYPNIILIIPYSRYFRVGGPPHVIAEGLLEQSIGNFSGF